MCTIAPGSKLATFCTKKHRPLSHFADRELFDPAVASGCADSAARQSFIAEIKAGGRWIPAVTPRQLCTIWGISEVECRGLARGAEIELREAIADDVPNLAQRVEAGIVSIQSEAMAQYMSLRESEPEIAAKYLDIAGKQLGKLADRIPKDESQGESVTFWVKMSPDDAHGPG